MQPHRIENNGTMLAVTTGCSENLGRVVVRVGCEITGKGWLTDTLKLDPDEADDLSSAIAAHANEARALASALANERKGERLG